MKADPDMLSPQYLNARDKKTLVDRLKVRAHRGRPDEGGKRLRSNRSPAAIRASVAAKLDSGHQLDVPAVCPRAALGGLVERARA